MKIKGWERSITQALIKIQKICINIKTDFRVRNTSDEGY